MIVVLEFKRIGLQRNGLAKNNEAERVLRFVTSVEVVRINTKFPVSLIIAERKTAPGGSLARTTGGGVPQERHSVAAFT